ncbi:MAG: translation initiation factor IF-3 [Anaeroplasmataceae bacterium]
MNKQRKTTSDDTLVNEDIRCKEVLVITNDGEKLGVLSRTDALKLAQDRDLDLVLVSPDGKPPVAKLMNYSKFRFEQQKKLKEMKKNQKITVLQEIRLSPTIEENDFETKAKKAIQIIEKGNKVKVNLRFYGRMITHQDIGRQVILKFSKRLEEHATVETSIKSEGRSIFLILAPKNDK